MQTETPVIFRRWKDDGVIALFPTMPFPGMNFQHCFAFERGKRMGVEYSTAVADSFPCSPSQYADLLAHLRTLTEFKTCTLVVYSRASADMHLERVRALRKR